MKLFIHSPIRTLFYNHLLESWCNIGLYFKYVNGYDVRCLNNCVLDYTLCSETVCDVKVNETMNSMRRSY
jgi:hypothetical protein